MDTKLVYEFPLNLYLSYNVMSSPSSLPAQDSMSLVLVTFQQKSHFLDLSSFPVPADSQLLSRSPQRNARVYLFPQKIPLFLFQLEPHFAQVVALILPTERFTAPLALSPPQRCCLKLLSAREDLFCFAVIVGFY